MVSPSDIYGGNSPEEAARIFLDILKGKGTWAQNAVVLANAAMALYCTGSVSRTMIWLMQLQLKVLKVGKALTSLKT